MKSGVKLISTKTAKEYPINRINELSDDGHSLEVKLSNIQKAKIKKGTHILNRFVDFLPFTKLDLSFSLGEGNTSLLTVDQKLKDFTGLENIYIKNETQNPTWSFKDRGSLACIFMAEEMDEDVVATISTGNMGHSISSYAAKANKKAIIFVPHYTPKEKIMAMSIHGAKILKVAAPTYSEMKSNLLSLAEKLNLRIVSGNGPIRVEGYKIIAFEIFEQLGHVPDYIAVPTSACGNIRGIFKGFKELLQAGIINKLPKMIVVQAKNNSPLVSAIKQKKQHLIPFSNFHTIAEAITSGNPPGGDEIIDKAYEFSWLAEYVTEDEILESQKLLAQSGFFVESASATSLYAVKKLKESGKISVDSSVVLILTGSGLKDMDVFEHHDVKVIETDLDGVKDIVEEL